MRVTEQLVLGDGVVQRFLQSQGPDQATLTLNIVDAELTGNGKRRLFGDELRGIGVILRVPCLVARFPAQSR